ncbi:hypothetical protein N9Y89_00775 [bacterium]|nr:hypothetical protein [bacterium]
MNEILNSTLLANPSWDGTNLNGEVVPSADYYYIIKFNNPLHSILNACVWIKSGMTSATIW